MLLARLLRIDELVTVRVPTIEQEAARDLVRARGRPLRPDPCPPTTVRCCCATGTSTTAAKPWTTVHDNWLRSIRFEGPERGGTRAAFDADYETVQLTLTRRDRLDAAIAALARTPSSPRSCAGWAACAGVSTLTALGLAVEIGDWDRFTGASIGAYLGLVPSEHSSGESRRRGPITKAGNTRPPAADRSRLAPPPDLPGRPDHRRNAGSSPWHRRRTTPGTCAHRRWRSLDARKKPTTVSNTAIARELARWCWSLATFQNRPPEQADHA